ncbi:MAG: hypothetical protein JXA14_22855 [Anaerolineae bacterium]|nr:hypothetical protein [Anaerolineae bacterium]
MAKKSKTIDGKKYYSQAFAIVGEADAIDTWKLPHHGPGDRAHDQLPVDWSRLPLAVTAAVDGKLRGNALDATEEQRQAAAKHFLAHYRKAEKEPPAKLLKYLGMAEARPIGRGQAVELTEMVKGSYDYMLSQIRRAFYDQFYRHGYDYQDDYWVYEIFQDYIIVNDSALLSDEYWQVGYQLTEDGYDFDDVDKWQLVQLVYEPVGDDASEDAEQREVAESRADGAIREIKVVERIDNAVRLEEAKAGGPRYIAGVGITADVVNANGRRYPAPVLRDAVREAMGHLHESLGQGHLGVITGEAEHPSDKGQRPQFLETIVRWEGVTFNEETSRVEIRGRMLETSKGKDAIAIMEGGVLPSISLRGYGKARMVEEDGREIEHVTELIITGFDLLSPGEQSDPNGQIHLFESATTRRVTHMDPKELQELIEKLMGLDGDIAGVLQAGWRAKLAEAQAAKDEEKSLKLLREMLGVESNTELREKVQGLVEANKAANQPNPIEAKMRETLGAGDAEDPMETLEAKMKRLRALEEAEQARKVEAYIDEQVAAIVYPKAMKSNFVAAIKGTGAKSIDEAKRVIIEKRKEYDKLRADLELELQGRGIRVIGPVLESETGVPAFAGVAYQLTESLIRTGHSKPRKWNRGFEEMSPGERFAKQLLEKFDKEYKDRLLAEQKLFDEAEQTSNLSLPYMVSRLVIAEAVPELVAASIFDVGVTAESEFRLYFETYAGEAGSSATVTNESVTLTALATWYDLDYKRVQPGTVTVTNAGGTVTYTEGTDYAIDYANGKILGITGGAITAGDSPLVDYTYDAIRLGEMQPIKRGMQTLSYVLVSAVADRLAAQISDEAIKFSRAQLGWDATSRTLAALVREIREKIDQGMLYLGLGKALSVASNSGGTWSATPAGGDTYQQNLDKLLRYIGVAKVKVANRHYEPNFILASKTNADVISNSRQFTSAEQRLDAQSDAAGYVRRVKGVALFESSQFGDSYILVGNRELVMYRVFQAMVLKGPFPSYHTDGTLIAADQYYAEEYNVTEAPIANKGAYVKVTA